MVDARALTHALEAAKFKACKGSFLFLALNYERINSDAHGLLSVTYTDAFRLNAPGRVKADHIEGASVDFSAKVDAGDVDKLIDALAPACRRAPQAFGTAGANNVTMEIETDYAKFVTGRGWVRIDGDIILPGISLSPVSNPRRAVLPTMPPDTSVYFSAKDAIKAAKLVRLAMDYGNGVNEDNKIMIEAKGGGAAIAAREKDGAELPIDMCDFWLLMPLLSEAEKQKAIKRKADKAAAAKAA